ncbi:MAG: GDP-mannose 4,6-dehydratase [Desulfobulbaceae bacterium DB1]|nr:MAG: GDP-mannose 4,6-dehydratase [Desulfobulbaceae bacterium DB1]
MTRGSQRKRAFITGITGQDGSYLAELLLAKGYTVYGLVRRVAFEDAAHRMHRIAHLLERMELIPGSLESFPSLYNAIRKTKPDEVYHLAAQSYVSASFEDEFSTMNANINGTHNILAACRDLVPQARFYFAGSSEMFGRPTQVPQNENTPFDPRSAYGISKVAGFHLTKNYRETYNFFACSGILYNHESPRRGFEFVTRKITSHVAKIKKGLTDRLELGNLDSRRDWGHARKYMEAVWLMLQQPEPKDYVICSGKTHTVREFCKIAFDYVGLDYRDYVHSVQKFYRADSGGKILIGDPGQAENHLGWRYDFPLEKLVHEMVDHDLSIVRPREGDKAVERFLPL